MTRESDDGLVVAALRDAGLDVNSVFDLVNTRRPYPQAIPALLRVLPTVQDHWIKEGIVRALAVPEARGLAGRSMVAEFERIRPDEPPERQLLKWAIGNTIEVIADSEIADDVIRLLRTPEHGKAREMLVLSLLRLKDSRVEDLLLELLDDSQLAGHAVSAIAKKPFVRAAQKLNAFMADDRPWVRRKAQLALKKLGA
jgi:HEAT repeat protein